jgi:hypothetical protein
MSDRTRIRIANGLPESRRHVGSRKGVRVVGCWAESGGAVLVVGLLVGPALGLLAWDVLVRQFRLAFGMSAAAIAILGIVLLVLPLLSEELRLGLVAGLALGALLAMTPLDATSPLGERAR